MSWATDLIGTWGYLGVILAVALENLFPPIPSEAVLPFAGFLAARGFLSLPGAVAAATLGSVLGALVLYHASRALGRAWIYRVTARWGRYLRLRQEDVEKGERWFARHGPSAVFFCRMLPLLRSLISIPAGVAGMRLTTFLLYTAAGTLLWNAVLIGIGAGLGTAWPVMATWIAYYEYLIAIAAIGGVVFLGGRLLRRS
ncbi:MAG: DedA family protein [Firmicutes bacterium]|nr:DedA family protein [Bacillota bacterium]